MTNVLDIAIGNAAGIVIENWETLCPICNAKLQQEIRNRISWEVRKNSVGGANGPTTEEKTGWAIVRAYECGMVCEVAPTSQSVVFETPCGNALEMVQHQRHRILHLEKQLEELRGD
jgi:hypothetical protein